MRTVQTSGATAAPPILLQADRVRRRIAASDSVAALVAELAYGVPREGTAWAWPVTATSAGAVPN